MALREKVVRAHERGSFSEADWRELAAEPPTGRASSLRHRRPARGPGAAVHREGRHARAARLIEPTAGRSDADLRLPAPVGRLVPRDTAAERRRRPRLGARGHLRGHARVRRSRRPEVRRPLAGHDGARGPRRVPAGSRARPRCWRRSPSASAGSRWRWRSTHARIHFFNFIALPITFGIGVDYAVNFVQRYDAEGRRSIVRVLENTGGPVILCSLTTTLGYLALLRSINQAVRGLGALAVVGEVACLLAAVLVLPAAIVLVRGERGHSPRAPQSDSRDASASLEPGPHGGFPHTSAPSR